jgi:hypothetical protein
MIEVERSRLQEVSPEIFQTEGKKLALFLLDFLVCPPTKTLIPPENFTFCKHHDSELHGKWAHLRENMNTLVRPTLVVCVQIERGAKPLSIFRVVTTTLKDEPHKLMLNVRTC